MALRIFPLILTFILLGAHFFRNANIVLTLVCVAVPLLLFVKKRWMLLLVQGLTYAGTLVWLNTAFMLVQQRMAVGAPWMRMLFILLGVTVFTLYAGYLLNADIIKKRYL